MAGLIFASVVLVAAGVWVWRGVQKRQARASLKRGPGTSLAEAIPVSSFDAIDEAVGVRRCHCGAGVHVIGEGTRELVGALPSRASTAHGQRPLVGALPSRASTAHGQRPLVGALPSRASTAHGQRPLDGRRFRYVRVECDACEDEQLLYFDVTTIFH